MKQFTFNDILLTPAYSDTEREEVDISTGFCGYKLSVPIISSPMDSVTNMTVVRKMFELGGIGIHHRYCDPNEMLRSARFEGGVAVSPSMDNVLLEKLIAVNPNQIAVIDVAHGDTKRNHEFVDRLQSIGYSNIVSGNIATPEAALHYLVLGVKYLRVGIGGGAVCSTRTEIGVGVPQAYAIRSIYKRLSETKEEFYIISDGGHKTTADIVKALVLGADYVMLGSMLAGCNESPMGTTYRGMASKDAQLARGKESFVVEGVTKTVEHKGSLESVINRIRGSIEQACYYLGCKNIQELKTADWELITQNAYMEGLS